MKMSKNPLTLKTRFHCSLQSTGRVGKSTVAQAVLSYATFAGVDWSALDTDAVHKSLSTRWPERVPLIEAATTEPDAFKRLTAKIAEKATSGVPLILTDFPAQATPFLLSTMESQRTLDVLDEAGVRLTVTLFPADDETALASLVQVVKFLGTRGDYVLVSNPARYRTTQFEASKAKAKLAELGAKELHIPTMTASTLEDINAASRTAGKMLTVADAITLLPIGSRFEAEFWQNQIFAQLEQLGTYLVPDPSTLKPVAKLEAKSSLAKHTNQFDPLSDL
jgi:hypothetical protein